MCRHKEFTSLFITWRGRRKYPTQTKQSNTLFTTQLGFSLNIQRTTVLPTSELVFLSVSSDFFFLWTSVFMGRSCTRTPVSWEIGSHGWDDKKKTKENRQVLFLGQALHCHRATVCPARDWTFPPKNSLFLTSLSPIPAVENRGWLAARPINAWIPLRVTFSIVTFYDHW